MPIKPLDGKLYGSIPHLPGSRLGPGDHKISDGQARICTEKVRDKNDWVIVQEKIDGSCCGVSKIHGEVIPLTRSGYRAGSSPFEQHHLFDGWVMSHYDIFNVLLGEGERIVGEWCIQAHGTIYPHLSFPFYVFDFISQDGKRFNRLDFSSAIKRTNPLPFSFPNTIYQGGSLPISSAMHSLKRLSTPCDKPEGVVYRVERNGEVDFLAKYVDPKKRDGIYLPEVSGKEPIWNYEISHLIKDR